MTLSKEIELAQNYNVPVGDKFRTTSNISLTYVGNSNSNTILTTTGPGTIRYVYISGSGINPQMIVSVDGSTETIFDLPNIGSTPICVPVQIAFEHNIKVSIRVGSSGGSAQIGYTIA